MCITVMKHVHVGLYIHVHLLYSVPCRLASTRLGARVCKRWVELMKVPLMVFGAVYMVKLLTSCETITRRETSGNVHVDEKLKGVSIFV